MTIDTLSPEPSTIAVATAESEPGPASSPSEKPRRSSRLDDPSLCHFRYPNGRRCALPGLPAKSGLCLRHYNRQVAAGLPLVPTRDDTDDLSKDLLPEGTEFSSGEDVQKFLARLVVQVTRGRVSPRRAAVLGYLTNQLLNSHRAIDKEAENEPQTFVFDLPRPKRD